MFHIVAVVIQAGGLGALVLGSLRLARAPQAAERRAEAAGGVLEDRDRYIRGMTDFQRISGALVVLVGLVLIVLPIFAW